MEANLIKGTLVTALFEDHEQAERAIAELRENGVSDDALSIVGRHHETDSIVTGEAGDDDVANNKHIARGAIGGGALGAGLAVAAVLIPGVGPFIAGGILATALTTGVAVGAGIGGLGEALRDQGMNEAEAKFYETRMGEGAVLIGVDPDDTKISAQQIDDILIRNGGQRSTNGVTPAIGEADGTVATSAAVAPAYAGAATAGAGSDQPIPAGTTSL